MARSLLPPMPVLTDCGHHTYGLTSAVDAVTSFASKGVDERAALQLDEGALFDAWVRLGNLIETLGLRRAA